MNNNMHLLAALDYNQFIKTAVLCSDKSGTTYHIFGYPESVEK